MSFDLKYGRYCDQCGRTIQKAHRTFQQQDYCASCYPKVFVARECVRCGASARVHRHSQEEQVCRKCSLSDRTCQRCDKPVVKAGMISQGKPVCPACVPYFRTPQPCGHCNRMSTRLSAMPSKGIDEKICDSCRNKLTHATCSLCGKYRKVTGVTARNKPHCSTCIAEKVPEHACPDCQSKVLGKGSGRCRSCLNRNLLQKEARLHVAALNNDWAKQQCENFARWLWARQKDCTTLAQIYRSHQRMFERLDMIYSESYQVTAEALLADIGPAELRRHLLVVQFLETALGVKVTAKEKEETADQERIHAKLAEHRNSSWGPVLTNYATWLESEGVAVRTRRMYVATAAMFCSEIKLDNAPWKVEQARIYLRHHPGSKANLHKFVRYCVQRLSWDVEMPSVRAHVRTRVPITVGQLSKLVAEVKKLGLKEANQKLLSRVLAKSLGFTVAKMNTIDVSAFVNGPKGLWLEFGMERVDIPDELQPFAHAYVNRLKFK